MFMIKMFSTKYKAQSTVSNTNQKWNWVMYIANICIMLQI